LIEEIILVDDFSDARKPMEFFKFNFNFHSNTASDGKLLEVIPKVKLIRLDSRHGLIKARILGTEAAIGPVVLFLDSHVEATTGWLEPLLSRIKQVGLSLIYYNSSLESAMNLVFVPFCSF